MSMRKTKRTFKCDNDCLMSGCPGHTMDVTYQNTSDYITVYLDKRYVFGGDLEKTKTMIDAIQELIK